MKLSKNKSASKKNPLAILFVLLVIIIVLVVLFLVAKLVFFIILIVLLILGGIWLYKKLSEKPKVVGVESEK